MTYVLYLQNYYLYFIVMTHSLLCILYFNDIFYIHIVGSLEY